MDIVPSLHLQILSFTIHLALSETYNLVFHHTYLADANPEFFADSYLNDVPLYWYDSNNQWLEPLLPWRRKMADPELWQTLNTDLRNDQNQMRNLSTENITIQYVHGCTIFSNGSTQVSFQIALDGIEFLRFDVETGNFSTEIEGAQEMVNQLNANRTLNQMRSDQLNLCLGLLHRLLEFGNQTINRKEVPVVQVTQKLVIYDIMTLRCSVIGHYPREVSVMWDRNGHQIPERELVRRTLPLPDHTYLSFLSVDISPVTEDIFTCQVTHSSMASPLMLKWMRSRQSQDFSSSSSGGLSSGAVIAVCLAVVLLVSVLVFGFLLCDKERRARTFGDVFHNDTES